MTVIVHFSPRTSAGPAFYKQDHYYLKGGQNHFTFICFDFSAPSSPTHILFLSLRGTWGLFVYVHHDMLTKFKLVIVLSTLRNLYESNQCISGKKKRLMLQYSKEIIQIAPCSIVYVAAIRNKEAWCDDSLNKSLACKHQDLIWALIHLLAASHPIHLHACGLGKQYRMVQSLKTLHLCERSVSFWLLAVD